MTTGEPAASLCPIVTEIETGERQLQWVVIDSSQASADGMRDGTRGAATTVLDLGTGSAKCEKA